MQIILPKNHPIYTKSTDIKQLCLPLKEYFDVSNFSYIRISPDFTRLHLTTTPEWSECFYKNAYKYYQEEKENVFGQASQSGYISLSTSSDKQSVKDALQYNIGNSIVFLKKDRNYTELYFMGLEHHPENKTIKYENLLSNIDLLEKFITYFRGAAATLIKQASKQKIALPFLKGENLTPLTPNNHELVRLKFMEWAHQKAYGLSKREAESLQLLLNGFSLKEIAYEMLISPKTLEKHLSSLRNKTKTRTTLQSLRAMESRRRGRVVPGSLRAGCFSAGKI